MIHMVQIRNNVFEIILELQKNSTYLRNLSRKTFIPHSTLSRLLEKLIKQEIIETKKEGNILRFQLKDTFESELLPLCVSPPSSFFNSVLFAKMKNSALLQL